MRTLVVIILLAALGYYFYTHHRNLANADSALRTSLEELTRLASYTETGLSYTEYQNRLLTAKANIDVALQSTSNYRAKGKIERALEFHLQARNEWDKKIHEKYHISIYDVQHYWSEAAKATREAAKYISADPFGRQQIDAADDAEERQRQQRIADYARAKETPVPKPVTPKPTPQRYRYFLTQTVAINTRYGAVTVPAQTEVTLVQESSTATTVKVSGNEFRVLPSQITRVAY